MNPEIILKLVCKDCNWRGTEFLKLIAQNPFDEDDLVVGCPNCKGVNCLRTVCDEPKCWEEDTCGTSVTHGSPVGYRRTCYKHIPKK